jgi:hypothetical protein
MSDTALASRVAAVRLEAVVEVAALTAFLAPFLPTLLRAGNKLAERAADAVSDEAFTYARALWEKLKPRIGERPEAQKAAEAVAAKPEDAAALEALRGELGTLLDEDPKLRSDLAGIWQQAQTANVVQVTAAGDRSVAVGGDVTGSTIITGDQAPPEH